MRILDWFCFICSKHFKSLKYVNCKNGCSTFESRFFERDIGFGNVSPKYTKKKHNIEINQIQIFSDILQTFGNYVFCIHTRFSLRVNRV